MRLALFTLSLLVALAPLAAQAEGVIVSSFGCRPQLPCDTLNAAFPTTSELLSNASACVTHYMSSASNISVFSDTGLDSSGCLITNPDAFPRTGNGPTIPHCCLKKLPTNICVLQCDITTE